MSIFASIIIGSWATFFLYWIVSSFGIKRDISRSLWERSWLLRFTTVAAILGWLWWSSSLHRSAYPLEFLQDTSTNTFLTCLGAVLSIIGIALAIWARVHLGRNWSPYPALKLEHELVTSGPYGLIRHPIYTGLVMALLGSALASYPWFIMLTTMVSIFIWRAKIEEALMTRHFPNQYPEYKKRTWALIPYVW